MAQVLCPKCGSEMALRTSKRGPFYGCTRYPTCDGTAKAGRALKDRVQVSAPTRGGSSGVKWGDGARPTFKPLPEQLAVIRHVAESKASLRISALAGTGKSSTTKAALHQYAACHPNAVIIAQTQGVRINAEFVVGAPTQTQIRTVHSFGFAAIRKHFSTNKMGAVQVNKHRLTDLMDAEGLYPITKGRNLSDEEKRDNALNESIRYTVRKVTEMCQMHLRRGTHSDLVEIFEKHADEFDSEHFEYAVDAVPLLLRLSMTRFTTGISMVDMIWLPVVMGMEVEQFDLVVVDEAQDLNPCMHALACSAVKLGGKLVFVGDKHQSIMAFAGADPESMDNFQSLIEARVGGVDELPLTVSLRCNQSAARMARTIVADFQVMPNAPEGTVRVMKPMEILSRGMMTPGTMVTCRMNAPLVGLAWMLIMQDIPVKIQGADVAQELLTLCARANPDPDRPYTTDQFQNWLSAYAEKELEKLAKRRNAEMAVAAFEDKIKCLMTFSGQFELLSEVEAKIKTLFADLESEDTSKYVVLSSIHRAKGLEAHRVVCWAPHAPHPMAKMEWAKEQELHLLYVQWTRVKGNAQNPGELIVALDSKGKVPPQVEAALAAAGVTQ